MPCFLLVISLIFPHISISARTAEGHAGLEAKNSSAPWLHSTITLGALENYTQVPPRPSNQNFQGQEMGFPG